MQMIFRLLNPGFQVYRAGIQRRLRVLLVLFLPILFIGAAQTELRAEYFVIKNYRTEITFAEEGYADFVETIEVEFSQQRHGIFRFIPYRDVIDGKRVDRLIEKIDVDGFKFKTSKENDNLVIRIGDADKYVSGRQVYRVRYRVLNPLNFFEDHIEFYWDILGTSWEVDVERFSFKVTFPDHVDLGPGDVGFWSGMRGDTSMTKVDRVVGQVIEGSVRQVIRPGGGATLAVVLPKDAFKAMGGWSYWFKRHGWLLAPIPFLFAGFVALFRTRNKKQTIMTEFFPPDGISPAVAGGFVDHSVDNSDVLSLIPHLANKGYLRLEVGEGGFLQKRKITFFKLKNAGNDLLPFESQFFNALFSYGDVVELKSLKDKFYTHMSSVQSAVKAWIKSKGWYDSGQEKLGCWMGGLGVAALALGAYIAFGRQNLDGIVLMVTGGILFVFIAFFRKRSASGNETYRKLEGFRQFVNKAERPVIERLMKEDPNYYDKTMPYALAFGYLKKWNRQFDGLLTQPPSWYSSPIMYGPGHMHSWNDFSESFPSEINSIGSVFKSAPSSSGSGGGGFSGGSVGGGSGGGGGGSW